MIIKFPYQWADPLDLDGYNVKGIYSPLETGRSVTGKGPTLEEALSKPVGTPPLRELAAAKGKNALLLVDDFTRTTPKKILLPPIITELTHAGIKEDRIHILVASGTHRLMTDLELKENLGDIPGGIKVTRHNAHDPSGFITVGKTFDGTEIKVNRWISRYDFKLAVGQIAPHRMAGFSGGSKILQPGICDVGITGAVHWRGWLVGPEKILGQRDNPIRREMDDIASQVGLDFIVNVVLTPGGDLYGVYAGDYIEAHKLGCKAAEKLYLVPVKPADIVIIDTYPADADLWQATKAATPAEMVMKPGGSVIMLTPCPEGISPVFPQIKTLGYRPMSEIRQRVEDGRITDKLIASHLAALGRILEKGKLIIVSPGFSPGELQKLGLHHAPTVEQALREEVRRLGKDAEISVLEHGGKIFPRLIR